MILHIGKRRKKMIQYKWIVWVGGVDEYFRTHTEARRYANSMVEEGYDDVYLEENKDATKTD